VGIRRDDPVELASTVASDCCHCGNDRCVGVELTVAQDAERRQCRSARRARSERNGSPPLSGGRAITQATDGDVVRAHGGDVPR
jgi:hypothetical protein